MTSSFLLVTRIGSASRHRSWLNPGANRDFDVLFSAYQPTIGDIDGEGVHLEYRPGRKVEGYGLFLREHDAFWRNYDYICFWDEDLEASTANLNEMFRICASQGFKIAQPALSHDSHFSHAALLRQRAWQWRHVNFVEMMCPVFKRQTLEQISHLYTSGYESGIDLVWCNLVFESPRDFAVIDATPIRHCDPVGGNKAANGFTGDRKYEDEIHSLLERYGLPWLSCVPYSAVTASGREVRMKALLLLAALSVLSAVPLQHPVVARLRAALVHLRHVALRPARNIKVASKRNGLGRVLRAAD